MKSNAVANLYEDTETFNRVAGNLYHDSILDSGIPNQLKVILSEVQELKEGIETNNLVESVDGCIDVLVTVFGMMQKLEVLYGVDFTKACELVAANNLEKYIHAALPDSREIVERTVQMYEDKGEPVKVVYNEYYQSFLFLDSNGKVRKPFGFTPVNLAECIPTRH